MLFFKNGKEFVRISKTNWKNYLDIVSKYRISDKSYFDCVLKDRVNDTWCATCNAGIGSFNNRCVNKITNTNIQKYSSILFKEFLEIKNEEYYEIEINRNENDSTI